MPIRQILVPVSDVADAEHLIASAVTIAQRLKSHVEVTDTFAAQFADLPLFDLMSSPPYADLMKQIEARHKKARETIKQVFDKVVQSAGLRLAERGTPNSPTARWIDNSQHYNAVWAFGRLCELVIARRPTRTISPEQTIVEEALFETRRPILLIPSKAVHFERASAVAWNGSLEAATALERAIDLLDHHSPVTVIQVGELPTGALPAAEAVAYLKSHGFDATSRHAVDHPHTTAEIILREAAAVGAGLIIAGAYSHSRVREAIFGGVTATLIGKAHIPVFLAR